MASFANQLSLFFSVHPRLSLPAPKLEPVPNPKGIELANNGEFGFVEEKAANIQSRRRFPHMTGDRLFRREMSPVYYPLSTFSQHMIPNYTSRKFLHFHRRTYSGQFSEDGSFFYTASQDFKVRMYDTSHAFPWKLYKTVKVEIASWTVTDATLSNDNKWIAYSSITPSVQLASTSPDDSVQERLDFNVGTTSRYHRFGIWSLRFSADGRQIVAGSNDQSLYVYDIESKKVLLRLDGHEDDVNAVCFGDDSGNLLYSGSDDQVIKVWDRRSMSSKQEAGVLLGHVEGITYIDSKKDGRYLVSNGKDQSMKLWDIRKLVSSERYGEVGGYKDYSSHFDYRYQMYPYAAGKRHPNDCSVMTYTGHEVLRTLIRCHFSPPSSSGSQYLYTGSSNGKVHIYSLDGQIAKVIDVGSSDLYDRPSRGQEEEAAARLGRGYSRSLQEEPCVRDVAWHPYLPTIATSSWCGYANEEGGVMLHQWREDEKEVS
ncbi:WD40-repeat-containing domain protein [Lipomyces oligophaga]|uniref:WD40-repeat-containing domain protein n=1 Tax=Lipomyces oligophaga TaxID=45792 RepID=UPI0034CDC7D3